MAADRTPLGEAALNGQVDDVKRLLKAKNPDVDGEGGDRWVGEASGCLSGAPYYRPLGEAARMGHPEIVKLLLAAGAKVDALNYRTETALLLAAQRGHLEIVRALLDAGADPTHEGCMGHVLTYVSWSSYLNPDVAALLLERLPEDRRVPLAQEAAKKLTGKLGREQKKLLELLAPYVGGSAKKKLARAGAAEAAKRKADDAFVALGSASSVKKKTWAKDVKKKIGPLPKSRETLEKLCKLTLATPDAIAHPSWPELVTAILERSESYGDLTENAFGERMSVEQMEEDESGLMDGYGDEHLHTFDWVLELLAKKEAVARPEWADLVTKVCTFKAECVGYYSFGDEEIAALLAAPHVKKHKAFKTIEAAARKAFPFAKRR